MQIESYSKGSFPVACHPHGRGIFQFLREFSRQTISSRCKATPPLSLSSYLQTRWRVLQGKRREANDNWAHHLSSAWSRPRSFARGKGLRVGLFSIKRIRFCLQMALKIIRRILFNPRLNNQLIFQSVFVELDVIFLMVTTNLEATYNSGNAPMGVAFVPRRWFVRAAT